MEKDLQKRYTKEIYKRDIRKRLVFEEFWYLLCLHRWDLKIWWNLFLWGTFCWTKCSSLHWLPPTWDLCVFWNIFFVFQQQCVVVFCFCIVAIFKYFQLLHCCNACVVVFGFCIVALFKSACIKNLVFCFCIVAGDEEIGASHECTQKRHKYVWKRPVKDTCVLEKRPIFNRCRWWVNSGVSWMHTKET